MNQIATIYRSAQFYAHMAHNIAKGQTFFQDHEFLGELYSAYESAYDSIIERMIGLGQNPDISGITMDAATMISDHDSNQSTQTCLSYLLSTEKSICAAIKEQVSKSSVGTQNLLQGLADESEMRQYKLGQRLK
jgi:DNA-binding ferritin-like protein